VQKNQPNKANEELLWLSGQIKKIVDNIIWSLIYKHSPSCYSRW
jgi:hypothetical protein